MAAASEELCFNRWYVLASCTNITLSIAGQAALDVGKAFFNKQASGQLTNEEKEQLSRGPELTMTDAEASQRVKKITKRIQTLVMALMQCFLDVPQFGSRFLGLVLVSLMIMSTGTYTLL